ncbi:MAG: hypothetical protein BGO33_15080 [Bacteroidia bacterium 43-41]|nr:MAG: hypothetical protein BGO33_15080 [Bacteroidia bacterium 43-41]
MYPGVICVSNISIGIAKVILIFNKNEKTTGNFIKKYKMETFAKLIRKCLQLTIYFFIFVK